MQKFTFWPNTIKGLTHEISVLSDTFEHARRQVIKQIYLHKDNIENKYLSDKDNKFYNKGE